MNRAIRSCCWISSEALKAPKRKFNLIRWGLIPYLDAVGEIGDELRVASTNKSIFLLANENAAQTVIDLVARRCDQPCRNPLLVEILLYNIAPSMTLM